MLTRLQHAGTVLIAPLWAWVVVGGFGLLSVLTWARDEFIAESDRSLLTLPSIFADWTWQTWALAGIATALACMFEASYRGAKTGAAAVDRVNRELKEAREEVAAFHHPNLSLAIDGSVWGGAHPTDPNLALVLAVVSVANTGAPSVCDPWSMKLEIAGVTMPIHLELGPAFVEVSNDAGESMRFHRDDLIHEKTIQAPVPTGGKVRGHLLGFAPVEFVKHPGTATLTVSFEDVRMKTIATSFVLGSGAGGAQHFPGMKLS